jgi:hypothetical protein
VTVDGLGKNFPWRRGSGKDWLGGYL